VRFFHRLLFAWFAVTSLAWAFLWGTLLALPFLPLRRGVRERFGIWASVLFGHCYLRFAALARPVVTGTEHVPYGTPYLVISNHRSNLDPPMLVAYARAHGVSKQEVLWVPFVGYYAYLGGAVYFDRKDPVARKRALHETLFMCLSRCPMHVYPEGTRTRDGEIRDKVSLKLIEAAWQARLPVVPASLWGTERVFPRDALEIRPFRKVWLSFRKPVQPSDFDDATSFAEHAWAQVVEGFEVLRSEHPDA